MKKGIAITTFTSENTDCDRYIIIEDCLNSVRNSIDSDTLVVVVNDGSSEIELLDILEKFPEFLIITKDSNKGIAAAKNTCIECLYRHGVDVMFIMDDDIILKPGFSEFYLNGIENGFDHFSYMVRPLHTEGIETSGKYLRSNQLNGCFITVTRSMVDKIGYFKILPNRYGHEHTEYTLRAIKHGFSERFIDLAGSDSYIEFHPLAYSVQSEEGISSCVDKINQNSLAAFSDDIDYVEFKD